MRVILISIFIISLASATENILKNDNMNGYKLSTYEGFEKKWKLITVRFRKDSGEMRFTYANDLAYKNLLKNSTDYPDGAVFAKISQKTQDDPAFGSSAVPSGARRYQYMVRNKKKHATTDGWGYALFDKDGIVFPEKIETQTASCAACHRIVPQRGYVFSQMMSLSPGKDLFKSSKEDKFFQSKITYVTIELATGASGLDEKIRNLMPKKTEKFRKLDHEISKYLFQGALDELKPSLTKEAIISKMPALVVSEDQKDFSLVFVENFDITCEAEGKVGYFVKAISLSEAQKGKLHESRYCWVD